jgi:hypothetical protein
VYAEVVGCKMEMEETVEMVEGVLLVVRMTVGPGDSDGVTTVVAAELVTKGSRP